MKALVVHAHPEPKSFTTALMQQSCKSLSEAGWSVSSSDLYAMDFDPVARKSDFKQLSDPAHFRYNREGGAALALGNEANGGRFSGFNAQLKAEMEKLEAADLLVFTAPVWWFSLPAILKGWIDKVLVLNFAYGHQATYKQGPLKGKKAMLVLTSGGPQDWYSSDEINGSIEKNFYHVHHGVFYYCGMTVLEPFVAYMAGRASDEQRASYLAALDTRIKTLDKARVVYTP